MMNFWQYIVLSTGTVLGPIAINMVIVSVLGILTGIALMKLPKEFAQGLPLPMWQRVKAGHEQIGKKEGKLRDYVVMIAVSIPPGVPAQNHAKLVQ